MAVMDRPTVREEAESIESQAGWATYPALAYDGSGTLWTAWLERLEGADAVYLAPAGDGEPREVVRAEAIKDGPSLAWTAADGLCCAWQYRNNAGAAGRNQEWRLAVATHLERGGESSPTEIDTSSASGQLRPSHPVLASAGDRLFLGYELHDADGAKVILHTGQGGEWSKPVALSGLPRPGVGVPEGAYEIALTVAPDGVLWAAWIETRDAGFAVWAAHAPAAKADAAAAWSAPERISGEPHLPSWPRLLAAEHGLWVTWANFSGGRQPAEKLPAWADGPERRWERLGHKHRRRLHVRRWDAASRTWGPEWRESEPPANDRNSSHYPVLVPIDQTHRRRGDAEEVALVCRRAVPRALGWT